MWNVYEYRPNDEKVAAMLLVAVVCLVVTFSVGYMLGIRNVHDNGAGTEPIGQQLNEVGTNIGNAKEGIDSAQNHIATGAESVDYLQGTVSTSAELVADCKRILETVRSRGKTDKAAN